MTANIRSAGAVLAALALIAAPALAVDYVSAQNGSWGTSSTWSPAGVPGSTDNVTIGHQVTLNSSYSVNNITIGSGGEFVTSSAYSLQVYGNWTNNGTATLTNGYVFFVGAAEATIGGTNPTTFYRLQISKTSTSDTVYLSQHVKIAYGGSSAVMVNTGNFVTNGYNFDADTSGCRVDGSTSGRFWVTGASRVDIYYLYQWGLGYFYMVSPSATLNIYQQDIANSGHRMDIYAGTVNYLATGSANNLQLYTNNPGWGWFARGGTITFNGTVRCGNFVTMFVASDSSVVKFAGSSNSSIVLHAWASAGPRASWHFGDLRIEKTGGAAVTFSQGSASMDSSVTARKGVTVNSGAGLVLAGTFNTGLGFDFHNVTNNGTITHTSAPLYIGGNWTGSGTFVPNANTVTFDSTTAATLAGGTFYNVTVNKTGGGSLSLTGSLTVNNSLVQSAGTFAVGEHTLTLGTASASGSAAVNGGTFSAVGSAFANGTVTASSQSYPYGFSLAAAASIRARFATFRYMNSLGLGIAGTVDPTFNFGDCSFDHGSAAGPMLTFTGTQTVDDMYNLSFTGSAGYNIEKTNTGGHITVIGGGGNRWGESYDNDPNDRVDWIIPDVGVAAVLAPTGTIPIGQAVYPYLKLKNYGTGTATFDVVTRIMLGASWVYDDTIFSVTLTPGDSFNRYHSHGWTPAEENVYTVQSYTVLRGDVDHGNDTAYALGRVVSYDVGVSVITRPVGSVGEGTVVAPEVVVTNYGPIEATTGVRLVIDDGTDAPVYDTTETGVVVPVGGSVTRTFTKSWTAAPQQQFTVTSWTTIVDLDPSNDTSSQTFNVVPPWAPGWHEVEPMPAGTKAVKDGGWLAIAETRGLIYAARGAKTGDFYSFDVMGDSDGVWAPLTAIPGGTEAKPPYKGAVGVCDNSGHVYATKGNNTVGFWRYSIDSLTWTQFPDVPLGPSGKKVKGGTDMVYVQEGDTGFVYLLKGYKQDFFRFNTVSGVWDTSLEPAPAGARPKWDKGSWMVGVESETDIIGILLAHKAKYHELWGYDVATRAWGTTALPGMPLVGMMGKSKKSKDGGCAAYSAGALYALKGGNTQEFWKYLIATSAWTEEDTIPAVGSTGSKKRVKAGGDIVAWDEGMFFCLKGNKTNELWRYFDAAFGATPRPERSGVAAGAAVPRPGFTLTPNPVTAGRATLRYGLPAAGPAVLRVYDVSGRTVLTRALNAGHQLTVPLDLRGLAAGVYLVKLDAPGFQTAAKLVVR